VTTVTGFLLVVIYVVVTLEDTEDSGGGGPAANVPLRVAGRLVRDDSGLGGAVG
jgi:hypothetical protein